MKMSRFVFVTLAVVIAVLPLRAQENIEKSYQRMASDPKVQVKTIIQVDRKPGAVVDPKASQCEIHKFYIRKANKKGDSVKHLKDYVADMVNAIQSEASNLRCYRIISYEVGTKAPRMFHIVYGEGTSQYVSIGASRMRNYIFACFFDEKNPSFRWCYALEWANAGPDDIAGQYTKVYSKIPEGDLSEQSKDYTSSSPTAHFFKNFNALKWRWMNKEYQSDTSLPVSVYMLVKDAIAANILTKDEKLLVDKELIHMYKAVTIADKAKGANAVGYISLAQKVLRDKSEE